MKKLMAIAAMVAACALVGGPALQAGDGECCCGEDGEVHFHVSLESWWVTPRNLSMPVAQDDSDGGNPLEGDLIEHDFGSDASFKFTVGVDLRDCNGRLSLSYWSYDDNNHVSNDNDPSGLLVHPDGGQDYYDAVDSRASIDAETIDLDFTKKFGGCGEKFCASWSVGLRTFDFDQDLEVVYDDGSAPLDMVRASVESDGFGLRGGVDGHYQFHERVSLNSDIHLSMLSGDTDASYWFADDGGLVAEMKRSSDRLFTQIDLDVNLTFKIVEHFMVALGYRYSNWLDAVTTTTYLDDIREPAVNLDRESIGFDGPYLQAGFRW